jgi:hypothetical protein
MELILSDRFSHNTNLASNVHISCFVHEELNLSWNFLSISSFYSKRYFIGHLVVLVESLANVLYVLSPARVPLFLQPDSGRVFGYPGCFLSVLLYMCQQ